MRHLVQMGFQLPIESALMVLYTVNMNKDYGRSYKIKQAKKNSRDQKLQSLFVYALLFAIWFMFIIKVLDHEALLTAWVGTW